MTDSQKNTLLVVVVIIASFSSFPSTSAFTQDLQHYTSEIQRRSYGLLELLQPDSMFMTLGGPAFTTVTFFVALYEFSKMLTRYVPGVRSLMGMLGLSGLGGGLPLLGHMPTEMTTARDGENREQRLINHLDHQVQAAVLNGQSQFENELKKKKK